jgi:hypothetical protein
MRNMWSAVGEVLRPVVVLSLWAAYVAAADVLGSWRVPIIIAPAILLFSLGALERRKTRADTDTHNVLLDTSAIFRYFAKPKHFLWLLFVSALVAAYLPPAWDFTKHNTEAVIAAVGAVSGFLSLCLVTVTAIGIAA